jgi:hypothetical protein
MAETRTGLAGHMHTLNNLRSFDREFFHLAPAARHLGPQEHGLSDAEKRNDRLQSVPSHVRISVCQALTHVSQALIHPPKFVPP